MHIAVERGNHEIVKLLLLQNGVDVNVKTIHNKKYFNVIQKKKSVYKITN